MELKKIVGFTENDSAELEISDPITGEPMGFIVILQNPNSMKLKKVREKWTQIMNKRGKKGLSVDQQNAFYLELADVGTTDWKGLTEKGEEVLYSDEIKESLLTQKWLCHQIGEFLVEDTSFLAKSGKN
jgi:hypothetical protein